MRITYIANNSGGEFWLRSEDYRALEEAGWDVNGVDASKDFNTIGDAIREFERLTGQNVLEEGCGCCGPPHGFRWEQDSSWFYGSGEELAVHLYGDIGALSKRELLERLLDE